jgi:anti-sigma B factor antagonist
MMAPAVACRAHPLGLPEAIMLTLQGTVRMHQDGQTVTFRVDGCGRMTSSLPLRHCAEQALAAGATNLRLDLRHCTYMDSTFLGTLLQLKRTVERQGTGRFVLVSPSAQCRQLLAQMNLESTFPVLNEEEPVAVEWTELCGDQDADAFKRNVVQAHEELATLEGPAGAPFREVVRCLKQDAEAKKLGK